jgi:hypothetical protein
VRIRSFLGALPFVAAAAVLAFPVGEAGAAAPRKLFAASDRVDRDTGERVGELYVVDPSTAKSHLVGTIRLGGTVPIAMDGLAVSPKTGVLYGITSRTSKSPSLVTIDPRTGIARMIGPLGVAGTDINFDFNGNLYVWLVDGNRLGSIDLMTGKVTPIGRESPYKGGGGGLAINAQGRAVVAAGPKEGGLQEVDTSSGLTVGGLALTDSSVLNAITALTLSPSGVLLAVNSVKGGRLSRELVTIDTETGNVTRIGALPDEIDAIAFADGPQPRSSKLPLLGVMLAVLALLYLAAAIRWRKK